MYYLILYSRLQGCGMTTIPEKYPTIELCKDAGKAWNSFGFGYGCIPAPPYEIRKNNG